MAANDEVPGIASKRLTMATIEESKCSSMGAADGMGASQHLDGEVEVDPHLLEEDGDDDGTCRAK